MSLSTTSFENMEEAKFPAVLTVTRLNPHSFSQKKIVIGKKKRCAFKNYSQITTLIPHPVK